MRAAHWFEVKMDAIDLDLARFLKAGQPLVTKIKMSSFTILIVANFC